MRIVSPLWLHVLGRLLNPLLLLSVGLVALLLNKFYATDNQVFANLAMFLLPFGFLSMATPLFSLGMCRKLYGKWFLRKVVAQYDNYGRWIKDKTGKMPFMIDYYTEDSRKAQTKLPFTTIRYRRNDFDNNVPNFWQATSPVFAALNQGKNYIMRKYTVYIDHLKALRIETDDWIYQICATDKNEYYSMMSIPISRRLPNVFFDNVKNGTANSRVLDIGQRLTMDVNFDDYFRAYSPYGYDIDTLALFSPEVLEALINNCGGGDVELYKDRLFLYIPVVDPAGMAPMYQALVNVRDALMNNSTTYADDRLERAEQRETTTKHASNLLVKQPYMGVFLIFLGGFSCYNVFNELSEKSDLLDVIFGATISVALVLFGVLLVIFTATDNRRSKKERMDQATRDNSVWNE